MTFAESQKYPYFTHKADHSIFFSGGYTVILYSEGMASDHQAQCMGVYRSSGYRNGRPVYKQDQGENYLYYHNQSWLIGPHVDSEYAWIR